MRIRIVGGGIGGLSAALAILKRHPDAQVTLFEQAEAFGEVGAGLQLSPNATRRLLELGLGDRLEPLVFRPEAAEVRDAASGALLFRTPLGEAAERRWGAPYWHVHRADLHRALLEALQAESRFEARLGATATVIDPGADDRQAVVGLADGTTVEGDLVIAADGWRSAVRTSLFGDSAPRSSGQVAWRGLIPVERLKQPPAPTAAVWTGPGRHFVHYYVRGGALVNFVAVVDGEQAPESWREQGDPAALAAAFAGWPASVRAMIEATPEVWRWGLFARAPFRRWSAGRVTLLGDAAHPTPPFLAQGAAMAIEDAAALARGLDSAKGVEAALKIYEASRRARAARVQQASRRNGVLFHLPGVVRRSLFGAASAFDKSEGMARLDWLYGA